MPAAISVVVPTVGRAEQLKRLLDSIAACDPLPGEVVVVDQSDDDATKDIIASHRIGATWVRSSGHGRGLAVDEGLNAARGPCVMVVDDDCTVEPDWVASGAAAMIESPGAIVCGQVLPAGRDPRAVPSTLILEEPVDYTGQVRCDVLYAGNMACDRAAVLAFGAFDSRIVPAAEDCDLCYRWLRAGRILRHDPRLVVNHHDWRGPEAMRRRHVEYYEGQGRFYAKHLRQGDLGVARLIARDVYASARGTAAGLIRGTPAWSDHRRGVLRGLPHGLRAGWREFREEPERSGISA